MSTHARSIRMYPCPAALAVTALAGAAAAVATLAVAAPAAAQDHAHPTGDPARLGSVEFSVTCAPAVQQDFEVAVAMLHSFWFEAAYDAFGSIAQRDPQCAMAYWGSAITLMGNPMTRAAPPAASFEEGLAAAQQARSLADAASHREQMYVDAALAYYAGDTTRDHATRMRAMEDAFAALNEAHADDMEAAIFYARTVVANAPPDDKTFAGQLRAATILQPLFDAHPDHPGLAHYLIHAYDAPQLAERGSAAAFAYAGIAPSAPHALHMPSHIFTRLGFWDESIETNARSAQASPEPDAAVHPMDYMVYAYLQQGRDAEARAVLERAQQDDSRFYDGLMGYNFVAMPARFALERSAWDEAAELSVPTGALPYVEAITHFARAIGAARSNRADQAQTDINALAALHARLAADGDTYWANVVDAQRLAASAWIALARGNENEAVRLAHEAAELESTFEKHPVTPGPILPARELEGDLLLQSGRPADARIAYEATLAVEPRRARALAGAARAAELAGDDAAAAMHYRALVEVMERSSSERPELLAARAFLAHRP